jgi:hypothetical protein
MEFNMQQFLDEVENEKKGVNLIHGEGWQKSYREGILEGIRLSVVIAKEAATADVAEKGK